MQDTVGSSVETVTEGMIVAVFVVISHITLELSGLVDSRSSFVYSNVFVVSIVTAGSVNGSLSLPKPDLVTRLLVLGEVCSGTAVALAVVVVEGTRALAELAFVDVELRLSNVGARAGGSGVLPVVGLIKPVDLGVSVTLVRFFVVVSGDGRRSQLYVRQGRSRAV